MIEDRRLLDDEWIVVVPTCMTILFSSDEAKRLDLHVGKIKKLEMQVMAYLPDQKESASSRTVTVDCKVLSIGRKLPNGKVKVAFQSLVVYKSTAIETIKPS